MSNSLDGPHLSIRATATTTPSIARVGASNLDERKTVVIQAVENRIYVGFSSSVSNSGVNRGLELKKDQVLYFGAGPDVDVYVVSNSGNKDYVVWELS